jgi:hypothetical protein
LHNALVGVAVCSVSPWQEDQVRAQEFPHNCLCSVDYDPVEGPPSPRATHQPTTKFLGARAARGSWLVARDRCARGDANTNIHQIPGFH